MQCLHAKTFKELTQVHCEDTINHFCTYILHDYEQYTEH